MDEVVIEQRTGWRSWFRLPLAVALGAAGAALALTDASLASRIVGAFAAVVFLAVVLVRLAMWRDAGTLAPPIVATREGLRVPPWRIAWADVAGIAIAAGYAVGRTGCWAVGDDYGRPWASRWAVRFPEGAPPSTVANMVQLFHVRVPPGTSPDAVMAVYPTQLAETALGVLMFLALWRLRDHRHAAGWLFGVYCVLAGAERFVVEIVRAKDDRFFGGVVSTAQVTALAVGLVGAGLMAACRRPGVGSRSIYARTAQGPAA